MKINFIHTYVSVDCVVFGFENDKLNILLVQRNTDKRRKKDLKLPADTHLLPLDKFRQESVNLPEGFWSLPVYCISYYLADIVNLFSV